MNIFVAKLDFSTTSEDLRAAFEQYGEVSSAKVIDDKFTGKSKGFGFVEMPNDEEATRAIEALDQRELAGRTILVKKSDPTEEVPAKSAGSSRTGNRPRIKSYSSSGGGIFKGGGGERSRSRPGNKNDSYGDRNNNNSRSSYGDRDNSRGGSYNDRNDNNDRY